MYINRKNVIAHCDTHDIFFYLVCFVEQKPSKTSELKSLRKIQDEDDQFNELKVTPEFQKFVAGKLEQLLDKQLSTCTRNEKPAKKHKTNGGVKLLRDSQVYLDTEQSEPIHRKVQIGRGRKDDSKSETEKVREAAVDVERILGKEEVKHWAKLYTKPHFRYKANQKGELVLSDE